MTATPIPASTIDYVPDSSIPYPPADRIVTIPGPAEPDFIHVEQIRVAIAALGLGNDLASIHSIHLEGQTVTVTRFRPSPTGGLLTGGDGPSYVTTTIGVKYA